MFTFVTGGLRSGKSEYALRRASELGPPPWLYVAAHIEGDDELKVRLASHRRDHDTTWKLIEAPDKLAAALEPATLEGSGAVVLDRFTVWLSKRIEGTDKSRDSELLAEVAQPGRPALPVADAGRLVTTEIGLGFLPANVPDRRLINVAGRANQMLADRASSVVLMVSGVPFRLR